MRSSAIWPRAQRTLAYLTKIMRTLCRYWRRSFYPPPHQTCGGPVWRIPIAAGPVLPAGCASWQKFYCLLQRLRDPRPRNSRFSRTLITRVIKLPCKMGSIPGCVERDKVRTAGLIQEKKEPCTQLSDGFGVRHGARGEREPSAFKARKRRGKPRRHVFAK